MYDKDYYIGLDMGTSSVGWAVTDPEYKLIRVKGKDAWGIREFDEAKTAVERRSKRISRRRRERQVARIGMLKEYFADEIQSKDPSFFVRLDNSKYFPEDKDQELESINAIFNENDYDDAAYYKQFPTIFHLRKALVEDTVENDEKYSRFVYLALLNMFKHRGHFLNASLSDRDENISISDLYPQFVDAVDDIFDISFPSDAAVSFEEVLSDRNISRSVKAEKLIEACNFSKSDKKEQMLIKCICGLKTSCNKLFELTELEEKVDVMFSDFSYDEKVDELKAAVGEEYFFLIDIMKQIYDAGILSTILHGQTYLSVARVEEYEKHKNDLKLLKTVYKEHKSEEDYDRMFRLPEAGTYSAYVSSSNTEKAKSASYRGKTVTRRFVNGPAKTRDALYKTIKKDISNIDDEKVKYILNEIEKETFLPKQLTPGNGVIPNQVHKTEMAAILRNAEKYLTFLKEKDDSGLTVSERIIRLFSFQIPYYIGPVTERSAENNGTGWVIRKEEGKVLPWNIEDKIDIEKTQEEFIKRLIRECTYISGEKVLPKASLEYEAYCVLNEINNIRIDGERIDVDLKQKIYIELFCTGKKITRKRLNEYLINNGYITDAEQVSGIDININNTLSSYGKFYSVFGDQIKEDRCKRMIERIIELSTIYGDSRRTLKSVIKKEFPDQIDERQLKRILGFKFKDWGRMSKAFLEMQGCEKETGEVRSLIRTLWETKYNLMELINSDKFTFRDELEEKKYKAEHTLSEFKYEDMDELYFSAPVKRMVWQTIQLIKEIEKIMGKAPSRIFIEMTRSDGEKGDKGRKDSRSKQLLELYKDIRDSSGRDWAGEIAAAGENGSLRSKKLYLYYTQMGKCMYTGKPIDLDELFTTKYDIDHIYPRHFVKDDNISNNLVLVNKTSNNYKSDNYPLKEMTADVYAHWRYLHNNKLISDEKYKRLTGRSPFTDEQKAGFIARQLVETSQGTKGVADLLKQILPDTTIVYAKGRNVSDFRRDNNFLKTRTLNDFHHAKDAYLNIVVGNVYYTKFTQNPLNFIKREFANNERKYHYNLDKMYEWDVERNGVTAWKAGENGTIVVVTEMMNKNTPLLTRLTIEAKGGFANETLYPASKAKKEGYIPFKSTDEKIQDVTKYGGFSNVYGAYFFLVEHDGKKNLRIRTLETVPIYLKEEIGDSEVALLEYCVTELGLKNPRICISRIKMQSLVKINGFTVRLSGRTGNRIVLRNEVQMCLDNEWNNYIHYIDKTIEEKRVYSSISSESNIALYDELKEKHSKKIFAKRPNPVGDRLIDGRDLFIKLSEMEQCEVLYQILLLSSVGPTSADLKKINGATKSGVMLCSKEVTKAREFLLINQSVTGLFESKVDLLKI